MKNQKSRKFKKYIRKRIKKENQALKKDLVEKIIKEVEVKNEKKKSISSNKGRIKKA